MRSSIAALLLALLAPGVALAQDEIDAGADADADADASVADASADALPEETDAFLGFPIPAMPDASTDAGVARRDAAADEAPLPPEHRPRVTVRLAGIGESGTRSGQNPMTGDLVHVEIVAEANEGDDIAVPGQSFAPFELHSRQFREEPIEGGKKRFVFSLALLALEPGEHVIGPMRLRVVTRGGLIGIVETERLTITVGSVLGNEPDAQPKPPTQPVRVFQDDYTLLYLLGAMGAILLTALITLLIARWWRRRPKVAPPPPPPRPPWELAMERLAALDQKLAAEIARADPRYGIEDRSTPWVDAVSDTIRQYLGARFGFDGLESTTDEITAHMRRVTGLGMPVEEVLFFLRECDLVKFAKVPATADQCRELMGRARKIVVTTTPVVHVPVRNPQPPSEARPGGAP